MPQTRGNVNWLTNNRIQLQEKKIRSENSKMHFVNRSLMSLSQNTANSILDEKYRSNAELEHNLKEARKEASKVFYQSKVVNEVGGQWSLIIKERKSHRHGNIPDKIRRQSRIIKYHTRAKSAHNETNLEGSTKKQSTDVLRKSKSAKTTEESAKVKEKSGSYSRSYRYLRSLVEIDTLSRERFQQYYESKLLDTKLKQEQSDLALERKLKIFYDDIDKFTKRSNKMDENRYDDKKFLSTLIMPNFDILLR